MIGDTLTDPNDPKPLPQITIDEPAISLTLGINTSPLAGKVKGAKVTARQVKDRLDRELVATSHCACYQRTAPTLGKSKAAVNWP